MGPNNLYQVSQDLPLFGMKHPGSHENEVFPILANKGVRVIINLTNTHYFLAEGFQYHKIPLRDLFDGQPINAVQEQIDRVNEAVDCAVSALNMNYGVVVHCRAGIGRTGMVLGCILKKMGKGLDEVIELLVKMRKSQNGCGWVETDWQKEMVRRF